MPPRARQSPVWSNGEVLDLISVWGKEAVQSQLRFSRRNYDTFGQISRDMMERGHDRDALHCRVKVKELWNAYHKACKANRCSGAAPATRRFYEELDAILGADPTSTPSTTMDTSEAVAAQSSTRQEEESGSEGAEEDRGAEPEDGPGGSLLHTGKQLKGQDRSRTVVEDPPCFPGDPQQQDIFQDELLWKMWGQCSVQEPPAAVGSPQGTEPQGTVRT
ncbi:Zinc finger and SCAN domain-containing protein 29 [Chelonia mydas]|uniref:Zinc finger and SCAN domain-containing protein 29 n=1 Tax=Chelonia mydas TaxID=8469 RepID=M7BHV2_CHEMY|nr:Zinc finger and SCAN domain-containing protein 29 [Chelonia mydas]